MWPASRLESHRTDHIATGKNEDFLWLWKMRKHNILVQWCMQYRYTSNLFFSFLSFLFFFFIFCVIVRDWENAFENFTCMLSTIGSIIVPECRLCTLLTCLSLVFLLSIFFCLSDSFIHTQKVEIFIASPSMHSVPMPPYRLWIQLKKASKHSGRSKEKISCLVAHFGCALLVVQYNYYYGCKLFVCCSSDFFHLFHTLFHSEYDRMEHILLMAIALRWHVPQLHRFASFKCCCNVLLFIANRGAHVHAIDWTMNAR